MLGGEFQVSNTADFSSGVVTLATISTTPEIYLDNMVDFNSPGKFRYIRYLSPRGGYCNISELTFNGIPSL